MISLFIYQYNDITESNELTQVIPTGRWYNEEYLLFIEVTYTKKEKFWSWFYRKRTVTRFVSHRELIEVQECNKL